MNDFDLGINPVTGDKMGTRYSSLCMHPGCYKVVLHGILNVCGKDHGGGDHGCGKYFCEEHLLHQGICWECYMSGFRYVYQLTQRTQKAKCEDEINGNNDSTGIPNDSAEVGQSETSTGQNRR